MFTDPATACSRDGAGEAANSVARGRRRFGDACQANSSRAATPATRHASQSFLRPDPDGRIRCQILLLAGFELNELTALAETFATVNRLLREERFVWRLASLDGQPVAAAGGHLISVGEAATAGDARHHFILSTYDAVSGAHASTGAWLCRRYAMGAHIAAIGGAGRLLAEAGLLGERICAIHWSFVAAMQEGLQEIEIEDRLFVLDDRIATCAGREATLDFALKLVADSIDDRFARLVADSLNHARPREAGERQLSELDFAGQRGATAIAHTVAAMRRRMNEGEDLAGIAAQSGVSQRQLQRLFRRHLGMTPTQYFLKARLQRARHLLQFSTLSVTEIAIATGFASISHFTRRYTELYGRTPTAERGRTPRRSRSKGAFAAFDLAAA
ncbi:MAG TPA: helix-turn-helix domain-containing protein [Dongiaceae bacterium]|nr:helix-turn-helix domain-containing protein [Dongiaceae bacterium]